VVPNAGSKPGNDQSHSKGREKLGFLGLPDCLLSIRQGIGLENNSAAVLPVMELAPADFPCLPDGNIIKVGGGELKWGAGFRKLLRFLPIFIIDQFQEVANVSGIPVHIIFDSGKINFFGSHNYRIKGLKSVYLGLFVVVN